MNLLKETISRLKAHGKTPDDVRWCGSEEYGWFAWEEFVKLADVEYSQAESPAKVAPDLLIVGDNWWMKRVDYENEEWWAFYEIPEKPRQHQVPKKIVAPSGESIGWLTLKDLDDGLDEEDNWS